MEIGIFGKYNEEVAVVCLGSELVRNGGFDSDISWIKELGWSISGGVAVGNTSTGKSLYQGVAVFLNHKYRVEFDVISVVSGSFTVALLGMEVCNVGVIGHYVVDKILVGGNTDATLYFSGIFNGTVDNVSLREIPGEMGSSSVGGEILLE